MASREVELVDFDDTRLKWQVTSIDGGVVYGNVDVESVESTAKGVFRSTEQGGSFNFQVNESTQDQDSTSRMSRLVVWRALSNQKSIEILDISTEENLEGSALKVNLPIGSQVAPGGVKLFEKNDRIILCVCTVSGIAYSCVFRRHPFSSSENRCHTGMSFLREKLESAIEYVYVKKIKPTCCRSACWFMDSQSIIHLAVGDDSDNTNLSNGPAICCLPFPDEISGEQCENSDEIIFNDSSLAQRLWGGLLMKRSGGNDVAAADNGENWANGKRLVSLTSLCRGESPFDDTFLVAVYADGKLRVWSFMQRTCRSVIDLFKSYDVSLEGSTLEKQRGIVEAAWVGNTPNPRRRSVQLIISLRLSSSRPVMMSLEASLTINQISLGTQVKPILYDKGRSAVTGYKLLDVFTTNSRLYSVWWQPNAGTSTLILSQQMDAQGWESKAASSNSISYDYDRNVMLEVDRFGADRTDGFLVKRLDLPGRFSTENLLQGVFSCFGEKILGFNQSRQGIISNIERIVRNHVEQEEMVNFHNAEDFHSALSDTWRRLIQDCENSWLQGNEPLAIGFQNSLSNTDGIVIVKRSCATVLREADWAERSLVDSDDPVLKCCNTLKDEYLLPLESYSNHNEGPSEFISKARSTADRIPFDELEHTLGPLTERYPTTEGLAKILDNTLDRLVSRGEVFELEHSDSMEDDTVKELSPCAEMKCAALQQSLSARSRISVAIVVILCSLSDGLPSLTRYLEQNERLLSLLFKAVSVSFSLSTLQWLAEQSCIDIPRSMEWIHGLTLPKRNNVIRSGMSPTASLSILKAWVQHTLEQGMLLENLVESACHLETNVLPFLDQHQQYEALDTVAAKCVLYSSGVESKVVPGNGCYQYFQSPSDRIKYLSFLSSKSLIWRSVAHNDPANTESYKTRAFEVLQVAAPLYAKSSDILLDYYIMAIKLFERAHGPRYSIELALRALKLPACTDNHRGVLCANIFARSLDLKDYKQALNASRLYPRKHGEEYEGDKYIAQLVSIMVERSEVKALCELPFQTYSENVWKWIVMKTLERKTEEHQSVDKNGDVMAYYHTFYTFCVHHGRFNEAANCMLLIVYRLQQNMSKLQGGATTCRWDAENLDSLEGSLAQCLTALRQTPNQNATLFTRMKPRFPWLEEDTISSSKKCFAVTLKEVEKLYTLAHMGHKLLRKSTTLKECTLVPDDLVLNLVDHMLWDDATTVIQKFSLSATRMFERMTSKYFEQTSSSLSIQKQLKLLDVVKANDIPKGTERLLKQYDYHVVVLGTMLTLKPNVEIPQWLISSFLSWGEFNSGMRSHAHPFYKDSPLKNTRGPVILLRELVKYNRIEEACTLATDLLGCMLDAETFQSPETYRNPPIIPVSAFDLLLVECQKDPKLGRSEEKLRDAISAYAKNVSLAPVHRQID
uniref:Uncharacterized protein n=1 Tax=Mucochytrium quahogii TaxID=96639 RepID=A0A7S2RG73_9STRA|mmetsp:Transcript_6671/g.11770  ORF Transcript_6671/g.11770 Transcript_6671/m.11770 type:complete len:1419 (-) Transcript_6671:759-5015(-)